MFKNQTLGSEQTQEVMSFGNLQPHWVVGMNNQDDKTAYAGSTNDTNDGFMFRPIKIFSGQWTPGAEFFDTFDPWSLFLEDPRIANRIAHFRNLRMSLKLKFLINGNPFYYGRLMAAYQPLPAVDGVTEFRAGVEQDFIEASQRLHVMLNPTTSEGGEMTLPFIYPKNYLVVPEREWNKMGRVTIGTFNQLQHANGSTKPVTITCLAYADTDVDLSMPTIITPDAIAQQGDFVDVPEGDEYGVISGPAHTIANISGKLADAPVIGPFARATELASTAVGSIASIFGFSRPRVIEENEIRIVRYGAATAVTNEPDSSQTLALDAKKEVTIDPRVTNAPTTDEMAIVPMAMRESFLTKFEWNKSQAPDYPLFQARVGCIQGDREFATSNIHMTPACFVSVPFNYWTGSTEYRIQVVCSGLHRGRLRIAWDPQHFQASKSGIYNANYSKIIDISECTDLTFKIGWGQETNYTTVPKIGLLPNFKFGDTYSNFADGYNGVFAIYVVNSLTSPSDDPNPVEINVFTRCCSDFEVSAPTKLQIEEYTPITRAAEIIPPPVETLSSRLTNTVPQRALYIDNTQPTSGGPGSFSRGDGVFDMQLNGNAFAEQLIYSPGGGSAVATYNFKALSDNTQVYATVDGVDTDPVIMPLTGDTASLSVTFEVGPGITYPKIEFTTTNAPVVLESIDCPVPVNWIPQVTPASVTQKDSTLVSNANATANTGNTPVASVTLDMMDDFKNFAAGSSRYAVMVRDGGLIGIPGENNNNNLGGLQSLDDNTNAWGPVTPNDYPVIAEPAVHFNEPWVPYWGDIHWWREDPDYVEGNEVCKLFKKEKVPQPPDKIELEIDPSIMDDMKSSPLSQELKGNAHKRRKSSVEYVDVPEGDETMMATTQDSGDAENMNAPDSQAVDTSMGPASMPGANQVYFGEQVGSIRQLLKRYTGEAKILSNAGIRGCDLAQYPTLNGTQTGPSVSLTVYDANLFDWFVPAFVSIRGGMRVKIYNSNLNNGQNIIMNTSRYTAAEDAEENVAPQLVNFGGQDDLRLNWSGTATSSIALTGMHEVEIPWYSRYRFTPARSFAPRDLENHVERDWLRLRFRVNNTGDFHVAYAAAEDFSLSNFLSTPIVTLIV